MCDYKTIRNKRSKVSTSHWRPSNLSTAVRTVIGEGLLVWPTQAADTTSERQKFGRATGDLQWGATFYTLESLLQLILPPALDAESTENIPAG